jgi:hypothetical protein
LRSPPMPASASIAGSRKLSGGPSRLGPHGTAPLSIVTPGVPGSPATPGGAFAFTLVPPPMLQLGTVPPTPSSPLPTPAPAEALRKPYHMMQLLHATMTARSGGYITRRLHVPHEVWSQGGVRLAALPEKARALEIVTLALEDLRAVSRASFGMLGVAPVEAPTRGQVAEWAAKLEDFVGSCDGVVAAFGKKLGLGESVIAKKSTGVSTPAWMKGPSVDGTCRSARGATA